MSIELTSVDDIVPSTYNPRTADSNRLDLIELSLRKLGFVLPLYASHGGEIISGHQRHLVAERMGLKEVPVFFIEKKTLDQRKGLNVAFNRATNDMSDSETAGDVTAELKKYDIFTLAREIPDRQPEEMFPCMNPVKLSVQDLAKINSGKWIQHSTNITKILYRNGVRMNIVVNQKNEIINGIGRLELYAELGIDEIEAVVLDEKQELFSNLMLNYLTMDFNIHERYADLLRYNSFRRPTGKRRCLGKGKVFELIGNKSAKLFDINNPSQRDKWIKKYGKYVLDFGAGLMDEANMLNEAGIECVAFEPFRLIGGEIDRKKSIETTKKFLSDISEGKKFDTVFLNAILNSVPFYEDRLKVARIVTALCSKRTRFVATVTSDKSARFVQKKGGSNVNRDAINTIGFKLEYEKNITLGDFSRNPKVQKFHSPKEWYDLWKQFFKKVQISETGSNVNAICLFPLPIQPEKLIHAIEFEFNLPYPDGHRMDLVDEALEAFSKRLKISLK